MDELTEAIYMNLTTETLGTLDARVARPAYDRSALGHGIVHVGLGNFHRAHQAVYLDDLFATAAITTGPSPAPECARPTPACATRSRRRTASRR